MSTVLCESGGRADDHDNPKHWGLWQIDYEFDGWDDPHLNTERAWMKFQNAVEYWGDGTHPWPVCGR